jgi:hypothetical protein
VAIIITYMVQFYCFLEGNSDADRLFAH